MVRGIPFVALLLQVLACATSIATAGQTLDAVKARGKLQVGVSGEVPGFSLVDQSGNWTGMEVDFARAVAAAVLGDSKKVVFVPLKASERFPALKSRRVDLLLRQTTWTLTREALLKLEFPGILYYDTQGFMVLKSSNIKKLDDLSGSDIGVVKGTTSQQNLIDFFNERRLQAKPVVFDTPREAAEALLGRRVRGFTSDLSELGAMKLVVPGGTEAFEILPDHVSREPLGPVVLQGDHEWTTIVRWVLFALILAEEWGVTSQTVDQIAKSRSDPNWKLIRGMDPLFDRSLGVEAGWMLRAIKASGNYAEMFERNLGHSGPLKLSRGINRLWKDGGLLYAPPVD
jgi:general L-amino acid transport system substrate-binding protein